MLEAGFSQIDITPNHFPVGTYMGTAEAALDSLGAHVAALRNQGQILLIASVNVVILDPEENSPAGRVSQGQIVAAYDNATALGVLLDELYDAQLEGQVTTQEEARDYVLRRARSQKPPLDKVTPPPITYA